MKKCKWAGDQADEYCRSCDGITMEVDGNSISCDQCAGYEAGTEDAGTSEEIMPEQVEEKTVDKPEETKVENASKNDQKSTQKSKETEKTNNNTPKQEKVKNEEKTKETNNKEEEVVKVSEEKTAQETVSTNYGEIKVTSLRYTSGATIKKGDNYFKFIAEEEWDVSQVANMNDDIREMLWAKLNAQVDSQIEELKNM